MTLELANRSITRPKGVTEDVFVKVGKFHFPTEFVVVDFKADPRVPLILGRSFLRTGHALIDVYGEEITLRVNDEFVTFNLDQVMRYSNNSVSRVNVINIASEEVVHDNTKSSNPTLVSESDFYEDPIVKTSPFGESDFFLEEIENCLKDDSIPMEIENSVFDTEGDILLIEKLLNEDPCQLPLMNLNQAKSLIEEPECPFSMGYEHFITTPVTKLDEVAESSVKNLVPIPRKHEVTSDDEKFKVYPNPLFDDDEINSDELESHCLNVESNFVESLSNHDTLKFDHLEEFSGALMPIYITEEERIRREHAEYISLMERLITINPCPRPTVNANTIVESLPSSLIPVQDNDSQREEIDTVTNTDELLPPGFENDDLVGEIDILEELHVDNSISNSKNELSNNKASDFEDNPSFPRPPSEPPDDEFNFELNSGEVISVVINNKDELECFDPGGDIDVSTNVEDDDYFPFTLVIHIFLPYLVYPKVFLLLLSTESEDTIFDPGIFV
nr:reverse transcriptase domain-containing protein [Tanacetum cinerariifolium]